MNNIENIFIVAALKILQNIILGKNLIYSAIKNMKNRLHGMDIKNNFRCICFAYCTELILSKIVISKFKVKGQKCQNIKKSTSLKWMYVLTIRSGL